jgi:hypothetical protein
VVEEAFRHTELPFPEGHSPPICPPLLVSSLLSPWCLVKASVEFHCCCKRATCSLWNTGTTHSCVAHFPSFHWLLARTGLKRHLLPSDTECRSHAAVGMCLLVFRTVCEGEHASWPGVPCSGLSLMDSQTAVSCLAFHLGPLCFERAQSRQRRCYQVTVLPLVESEMERKLRNTWWDVLFFLYLWQHFLSGVQW